MELKQRLRKKRRTVNIEINFVEWIDSNQVKGKNWMQQSEIEESDVTISPRWLN